MCQMNNILHIFLISCFSLTVISCARLDHEHDSTANTTPDTTTINFVVGTASGFILTSADGTNWTLRETAATNPIYDVIYANSKFVAAGEDGVILNSSDGTSWDNVTISTTTYDNGTTVHINYTTNNLNDITYGNSTFVAVGNSGNILTSSDGTSWDNRTSGTSNDLNGVSYENSTFVAVGENGTIVTSSDGITWTSLFFGFTTDNISTAKLTVSNSSYTLSNGTTPTLTSGTTYYWKVVASDPKGGSAQSETWSFTVQ